MSTTPAGWYDDGQHPGQQRWWDGVQWTQQYRPVPGAPSATPPAGAVRPAARRTSFWAWLAPLIVVVLAGIGIGTWLLISAVTNAITGPQDAVKRWATALAQQDCAGIFETMSPAGLASLGVEWADVESCRAESEPNPSAVAMVAFPSIQVTNGAAAVTAAITIAGSTQQFQLELSDHGGRWLIDSVGFGSDDDLNTPTGAEAVVLAYNDAWNSGDCDATLVYLSSEYLDHIGETVDGYCANIERDATSGIDYLVSIESTSSDGSFTTVTARVQWTVGDKEYDERYAYILLDNGGTGEDWLLDDEYPVDGDVQPVG